MMAFCCARITVSSVCNWISVGPAGVAGSVAGSEIVAGEVGRRATSAWSASIGLAGAGSRRFGVFSEAGHGLSPPDGAGYVIG
jgi:hypothetical protein